MINVIGIKEFSRYEEKKIEEKLKTSLEDKETNFGMNDIHKVLCKEFLERIRENHSVIERETLEITSLTVFLEPKNILLFEIFYNTEGEEYNEPLEKYCMQIKVEPLQEIITSFKIGDWVIRKEDERNERMKNNKRFSYAGNEIQAMQVKKIELGVAVFNKGETAKKTMYRIENQSEYYLFGEKSLRKAKQGEIKRIQFKDAFNIK